MRKLIVWVFMYSLDGLLADDGTEYWDYCFGLPADPAATKQKRDVYESAYAHVMGRTTYEATSVAMRAQPDHLPGPRHRRRHLRRTRRRRRAAARTP